MIYGSNKYYNYVSKDITRDNNNNDIQKQKNKNILRLQIISIKQNKTKYINNIKCKLIEKYEYNSSKII